jgi:hypothetical protein
VIPFSAASLLVAEVLGSRDVVASYRAVGTSGAAALISYKPRSELDPMQALRDGTAEGNPDR